MDEELKEVNEFLENMIKEDKTLRWTHLGTGIYDIPVRVHKLVYGKKETDIYQMAEREYRLYKDQEVATLESELSIYQGLLSGRSSLISQTMSFLTLFFSITAILLSLDLGGEILKLLPTIIVVASPVVLFAGIGLLLAIGADRLTVREFHVRILVLSHLLAKKHS